jgi:hypothetical protein
MAAAVPFTAPAEKVVGPVKILRLEFDKVRKLKVQHRYLRQACQSSGKSIVELVNDPFGGYPYVLQALLLPTWIDDKPCSIDKASDLIDAYVEKAGGLDGLTKAFIQLLQGYLHIETTPASDEDPEKNEDTPDEPGPSDA